MTDRELLELAAKAAGIERDEDGEFCIQPHQDDCRWWDDGFCTCGAIWNPLNDDGDALRLAVKLQFEIDIGFKSIATSFGSVAIRHMTGIKILEAFKNDPLAATRRAIVRAAAEIGRNMK
jgi:hypothetical protein